MIHSPAFLALVESARASVREISIDDFMLPRSERDGAPRLTDPSLALVDVREDHEWDKGHARGAVHVGRGILERDVEGLYPDKAQAIVLYCGGGFRSALSAENLQKMGYTNVWSLAGGWRAWNEKGLPTE